MIEGYQEIIQRQIDEEMQEEDQSSVNEPEVTKRQGQLTKRQLEEVRAAIAMVDGILERKKQAEQFKIDNREIDVDEYGGENTVSDSDEADNQS